MGYMSGKVDISKLKTPPEKHELETAKYFAERVLSVYKLSTKGKSKSKSFFARLKNTIKKGFY